METHLTPLLAVTVLMAGVGLWHDAMAQQPAQRILPRVVSPSGPPQAKTPCLPTFDDELRVFVRPCQQFHGAAPPLDWLDRQVAAVTWAASAIYMGDLSPDERAHIEPLLRGEVPQSPSPVGDWRPALRARTDAFVTQWQNRDKPRDRQALSEEPGEVLESFAQAKMTAIGPDLLDALWRSDEAPVPVTSALSFHLEATAGEVIEIETRALSPAPGYLFPDPVVWLVLIEEAGDPEAGGLVASVNAPPGEWPALSATAPETGIYRVLVAPYRPESAGRISLTATVDGIQQAALARAFFGGTLLRLDTLVPGDRIFARASRGGNGHDAVLSLLPPPGSEAGSRYLASNNHIGTLPMVTAPDGVAGNEWLLVSAFSPDHSPTLDIFASRSGRRAGPSLDADGDGLSRDLERLLGTCDSPDDVEDGLCRAPDVLPTGWTPQDTDGDGFSDFEEVHGIRRCYDAPPAPPRFSSGQCLKDGRGQCLSACPDDTAFVAQLPLSALDGPDPTVHDIYVELDYWQEVGAATKASGLSASQVALLERTFEQQVQPGVGGGPPQFGPTDYPINFHLFQDEPIQLASLDGVSRQPALAARSLYFDLFFSTDRKYTNVFHYVVGTHKGGGQSDVLGRAAIVGLSGGVNASLKLAHEIGHMLGLLHNFKKGNPDHAPFHRSIMSYGYVHTAPPLVTWDGEFRACSAHNPCPDFFRCVRFPGHGDLCAPDCGSAKAPDGSTTHHGHLASAPLPLPAGTSESGFIPEEGFPISFLPYLYCYNGAGKNNHANRFRRFSDPACKNGRCIACVGDLCRIDFDRDGDFDGLRGVDFDGDGKLNDNPLNGGNEFERLMARGPRGLRVLSKKTISAFYAGFTNSSAVNFLPYPAVTYEQHAGFVTEPTNRCDEVARWSHCRNEYHGESALFRGPVGGDRGIEVKLPPDYCLDATNGLTFSLRVKPFQGPTGAKPIVLAAYGNVRLLLDGSPDSLVWIAEVPGKEGIVRLRLEDAGALGRWTRVTVALSPRQDKASLAIRRQTIFRLAEEAGLGDLAPVCEMAVGADLGLNSRFLGLLDDPMLFLGYIKTLR